MKMLFWISFILLAYIFIGYPLFLALYAVLRKKCIKKSDIEPSVTLLIPAYNEEDVIETKIENSLSLSYPKDKIEILIASDGSTDKTNEIAKRYVNNQGAVIASEAKQSQKSEIATPPSAARNDDRANLTFLEFSERRGKPSVLNNSVKQAKGEIIVFSDASSIFDKDAIKNLVSNFADSSVGCVCGDYKFGYELEDSRGKGEGLYVKYELFIKKKEAQLGTLLGLHGAIYAIRKSLYEPLKPDMINDDYVVSAKIVYKGYKSVYEEKALAYERTRLNVRGEFHRRMRISAGNYQFIPELKGFLNPLRGIVFLEFLSHKLLRTLTPFILLIMFAASFFTQGFLYKVLFGLQALFYIMAVLGIIFERMKLHLKLFYVPYYFCLSNLAAVAGFFKFFTGRHSIRW